MDDKKPKWHMELIRAINGFAEEIGLDESTSDRMRDFILSTAKSQYMAGNRAGIYWARNGKNKAVGA
jgi:hypothetical protein